MNAPTGKVVDKAHVRMVGEFDYSREVGDVEYDPLVKMFRDGPKLVDIARGLRNNKAVSYRKVLVGSAVLAHNVQKQKIRTYVGWNNSPYEGSKKYCAEMRAIGHAISEGYPGIEAVFAAGETNIEVNESIIHIPSRILPPCEPCRPLLGEHTLVFAFGGEEDVYGAYTGQQLHERHLLGSPVKVKRNRKSPPPAVVQAHDLTKLDWPNALETYQELTDGIETRYQYLDELKMARTQIAVDILSGVPLAA